MAKKQLNKGDKKTAAKLFLKAAEALEKHKRYAKAAEIYEKAATVYREADMTKECFDALEKAMLMLIRTEQNGSTRREIVRINGLAGAVADELEDYSRAAEYYFRAADFEQDPAKRVEFLTKAADALENEADSHEMNGDLATTVRLLKKVGRIYNATDNEELGRRIIQRAIRISKKWAEEAKAKEDFESAATALAEAAQIQQEQGNNAEATRLLMDAAVLYERAELFEKAGNAYDAAKEIFERERLTTAKKKAMIKASEAYMQMGVQMRQKPEVVAPLLVKAGNMYNEVQSPIKARWAFKRAAEIFSALAKKAQKENDMDSANKYLKFQAMCLRNWGDFHHAEAIYKRVIDYYDEQARLHEQNNELESQAIALEEAAAVLYEAGKITDANGLLEEALEIYIQLAEDETNKENIDEASRLYSRAAECAKNMGDMERHSSFHWVACEKAVLAAEKYKEAGVEELAAIWYRTAGLEAIMTQEEELTERALDLFRHSVDGFKSINELTEAFDDLFNMFKTLWSLPGDRTNEMRKVIDEMQEIALTLNKPHMSVVISILRHLNRSESLEAQQILQDNEKALGERVGILYEMIEAQKKENREAREQE